LATHSKAPLSHPHHPVSKLAPVALGSVRIINLSSNIRMSYSQRLEADCKDSEEVLLQAEKDLVHAQDWALKCKARRDADRKLLEREKLEDIRNDSVKSL